MTEAEFLAWVMHAGRDAGLLMHHAVNRCPCCGLVLPSGTPGFPDVLAMGPGGVLIRELKTRAGVLSGPQRQWAGILGNIRAITVSATIPVRAPLFDVWRDPADRDSGRIALELAAIA
ncbi:MAG: hypothetical protein ACRDPD_06975, partial [Streptosporangiaceae bacterium]